MTEILERRAAICGLGISDVGRRLGIHPTDLTEVASRAAIAEAGLTPADIDGIASLGDTPPAEAATRLGIDAAWVNGRGPVNGGLLTPVMSACFAVASGQARHVLVYRTVQMMGGSVFPGGGEGAEGADGGSADGGEEEASEGLADLAAMMADIAIPLTYHAYSAANWLALHARRHMATYGTTKEQLGWLAITSRDHAALNPRAAYRAPMTMEDYLRARPISDPFGLFDCDVPVDGSIAVVVSAADHAADCPHPAVRVHAVGGSDGPGGWYQRPDYPRMASADAARQMWSRSELGPGDLDVAELYDGFTFLTLAWLEALGVCGDGESGPFVEGGDRIRIGGQLPLNTYGGQLSAGRMHGYWVLHEACLQLRGEAGPRQVADAEVAVVSNGGGPIAGCMLLTR